MTRTIVLVALFWTLQVVAQLLFKWGSDTPGRALWGFFSGHAFGVTSIIFLMLLYKTMNPNLALALGSAGGFLCAQGAVALLFRVSLTPLQYVAMFAIAAGMAAFSIGGKA